MNSAFIRYTPDSIVDMNQIREAILDEANLALHITYENGDMFDIPLSSGGQIIWDALCANSLTLFAG